MMPGARSADGALLCGQHQCSFERRVVVQHGREKASARTRNKASSPPLSAIMPWDEQLRPELASGSTAAVTFGRRATHAEARAPVEDSLDRRMRRAKDLPDLAEAAKHHTKTVANIRLPPPANAARLLEIEAEFQELEKKIAEFENPKTKQARELVLVTYREFCVSLDPGLPDGDEWLEACVEKNTVRFIWWRVSPSPRAPAASLLTMSSQLKTTRGQKNRQFVKASTLRSWVTMFILCVVWYCRGPNGEAIGIALLARRGLYDTLKRALKTSKLCPTRAGDD
jgi:hypothetical protein